VVEAGGMALTALAVAAVTAFVSAIGGGLGGEVISGFKALVARKIRGDRHAESALVRLERNPSDAEARQTLTLALAHYADNDPDFRRDLEATTNTMQYYVDRSQHVSVDQGAHHADWRVGRDNLGTITNQVTDNRAYSQRADTMYNVAGNQTTNYQAPSFDILPNRTGRVVIVIGVLICIAGFCAFGYPVLTFILVIFDSVQSQSSSPPDLSQVHFAPWIPIGFVLGVVGMFVAIVGALMRRRR
jgi:hypothetical protein